MNIVTMELEQCFQRYQGEQRKICIDTELRRLDDQAAAQAKMQQSWTGHPMDFTQKPEKFVRPVTNHADFPSIWASKLPLGGLSGVFVAIGAVCILFMLGYLLSVFLARRRTSGGA